MAGTALCGATGPNIDIEVKQFYTSQRNILKSGEIYRIGIEFYNKYGQNTPPKWICDLKIQQGNLSDGKYNGLLVTINNEQSLIDNGVVGWRVLRVERTEQDKTILCQGIVNSSMFQKYDNLYEGAKALGVTYADLSLSKLPSTFMRTNSDLNETTIYGTEYPHINAMAHGDSICRAAPSSYDTWPLGEIYSRYDTDEKRHISFQETRLFQLYSPEITFSNIKVSENIELKYSHAVTNTIFDCAEWGKEIVTATNQTRTDIKDNDVATLFNRATMGGVKFNSNSRIGGTDSIDVQNKYQYYRKFNFKEYDASNHAPFALLGTPLIIEQGQNAVTYENLSKYKFNNSLFTVVSDKNPNWEHDEGIISRAFFNI